MANYKNRNLLLNTNKYQRQIIKVALIPSLAFCILISVFLLRFRFELIDAFLYGTRSISLQFIDQWLIMIILGVWAFFVFILYQTFTISLRLVGPFDRVIRELDETIKGDIRRPIKARDHDELANTLLKRINVLIDNLPMPKAPLRTRSR